MTTPAAEQLRDVFDALATSVPAASKGYPSELAQWRRRERRRKLIVAILVAVIFTLADIIGLWALSRAKVDTHIIFNEPGTTQQAPVGGIGPPP